MSSADLLQAAWEAHLDAAGTADHDRTLAIYRGTQIESLRAELESRDRRIKRLVRELKNLWALGQVPTGLFDGDLDA